MKAIRTITIILFVLALLLFCGTTFYYQMVLDRVPPTIQCSEGVLEVSVSDGPEVLLTGVAASDGRDGDLTGEIMVQGVSRLLSADTARVTYVVFDASGNMASCTRTIRYTDYQRPKITLKDAPVYAPYPEGDSYNELRAALTATDVRDGDLSDQIHIAARNVNDGTEGTYRVNVQITNSLGDAESIPLNIVVSDKGAANPLVTLREYITYVDAGSEFDPTDYITAVRGGPYSAGDPNLTIESDVDASTPGYYQVCYTYSATGQNYVVYLAVVVR